MKSTAKTIAKVKYLAEHHKKQKVRKKNSRRLNKLRLRLETESRRPKFNIFSALSGHWYYGSHAGLFSFNLSRSSRFNFGFRAAYVPPVDPYADANRCVCCGAIIPEGRQVCLTCEGGSSGGGD